MKQIMMLVPDTITRVFSSTASSGAKEIEVTPEVIIQALTCNDYHESYFFPENSIQILSIVKI
ncbi:MAG: hypothetical protein WCQ99_01170 [Pseudomonadota bacterium]